MIIIIFIRYKFTSNSQLQIEKSIMFIEQQAAPELMYERHLCQITETQSHSKVQTERGFFELSVKTPQYFKDSVCLDLIQFYCPQEYHKCLIICPSQQKAEALNNSEFLSNQSLLIHHELDRRERVSRAKIFEQSNQKRCLITDNINVTHLKKYMIKMVIFVSPPKNYLNYNEIVNLIKILEIVVVCYSTKQINDLCLLERQLNRKFRMLAPPQVQSDSQDQFLKRSNKTKYDKSGIQYKVVIKNIDFNTNWMSLKQFLDSKNIQVLQVRVIIPKSCNRWDKNCKKTGFVICKDSISYDNMLKLDGTFLNGSYLVVEAYKNRDE